MSKQIKKYNKKVWADHLVQYPDRRKLVEVEGEPGVVELVKKGAEGDIYQTGDPIYADYLNNIEDGIENNNKAIIGVNEEGKTTKLKLMILEAALLGDVKGGLLMENFENVANFTIDRGIYDAAEQVVYCYDSTGQRVEIKGLGAAIA